MLKEHQEEIKNLKADLEELYAHNQVEEDCQFSTHLLTLVEGRISDLESMITIDEWWAEK